MGPARLGEGGPCLHVAEGPPASSSPSPGNHGKKDHFRPQALPCLSGLYPAVRTEALSSEQPLFGDWDSSVPGPGPPCPAFSTEASPLSGHREGGVHGRGGGYTGD